jgi:hypothetical protein
MKPTIYCDWSFGTDLEFDMPIEIFVDKFSYEPIKHGCIRIIIIWEPFVHWLHSEVSIYKDLYTYVFTYNQHILDTNDKSVFFLPIQPWVRNVVEYDKQFGVSTVVGGKNFLDGHKLRHTLWDRQQEITMSNKQFYASTFSTYKHSDLLLGDDKSVMFNTQYHIVIENMKMQNMFTEKLLDCFMTKTIPIYWGCTNIKDTFNIDGIIQVDNCDDIINICNTLTQEIYETKLSAITENYEITMNNYYSVTDILNTALIKLFNTK